MPCCRTQRIAGRRAFTIIEVVVLLAVGGLLLGLLIPAIGSSRNRARAIECAGQLQQIGLATNLYLNEFAGCLPQVLIPDAQSGPRVAPLLFGGKAGTLALDGLDTTGAEARPLNRFIAGSGDPTAKARVFRSPADRGGEWPGAGRVASTFELLGTSYALNDRLLRDSPDQPPVSTLIPRAGGPMPKVATPARTWLLASHPIHNFDLGGDRRLNWHGGRTPLANLLMVDLHAISQRPVPPGALQTTDHYTFKPSPDWPADAGVR